MKTAKDLFGHAGQAKMYKEFRPQYTPEIVEYILSKVSNRGKYVDIACGSGQLTKLIAPHFVKTVGIDQSFEQLNQADCSGGPTIEYKTGSAFDLPMEAQSVDLVTVAQGLHWLVPYEDFFKEVQRVLKPGGVFVTVGYSFPQLVDVKANEVAMDFYVNLLGSRKSPGEPGCWWNTNRPTIDSQYADIPFPSRSIERKSFPSPVDLTIAHYVNYLRTFSAYRTYMEEHSVDPLVEVEAKIMDISNASSSEAVISVINPFFAVSFRV